MNQEQALREARINKEKILQKMYFILTYHEGSLSPNEQVIEAVKSILETIDKLGEKFDELEKTF